MISAIFAFFGILLKFMAIIFSLFLVGYLLALLLRTIKLHAIGVIGVMAGLVLYAVATKWSDIRTLILAGILLIAWLACIKKVASVPKQYRKMKTVSNSVEMAWVSLYAFGAGSFALVVPAIENTLPWTIRGYDWYLYVSLAMLAMMPVVMISSDMDDIEKLKQMLNGRIEITDNELFDMVKKISKEDASEDDLKKKLQFVQEYLDLHKITVRRTDQPAAQTVEEPRQKVQPSPVIHQEATVKETIISDPFIPTEPLDINTASESSLAAVPGIGIILAKKAISIRNQKGLFESVDDFISSVGVRSYQEDQVRQMLTCAQADLAVKDASPKKSRGRAVEY